MIRRINGIAAALAARQAGYARPLVSMTVVGVTVGPNIEFIVDPFVVTNAGTPNERLEPIEPTAEMQQAINDAGRDFEQQCAPLRSTIAKCASEGAQK